MGFDRLGLGQRVALALVVLLVGVTGWIAIDRLVLGADDAVAEMPSSEPDEPPDPEPTPIPAPTPASTPAPTPTPTPTPTATPSVDPVEAQLEELRASDMWEGLAEYDRAGEGRALFILSNDEGFIGEMPNSEEVWNSFAPELRDRLLRRVIAEGIRPDTSSFPGTPIENDFLSGARRWWTNGPNGTQGRGVMFQAEASYVTADGQSRWIQWAVLVGIDHAPGTPNDGELLAIGPPLDQPVADAPNTFEGVNMQFNEHHLAWLFDQPVITEVRQLDCPEQGCMPED